MENEFARSGECIHLSLIGTAASSAQVLCEIMSSIRTWARKSLSGIPFKDMVSDIYCIQWD